jgi:hypothetical protein
VIEPSARRAGRLDCYTDTETPMADFDHTRRLAEFQDRLAELRRYL